MPITGSERGPEVLPKLYSCGMSDFLVKSCDFWVKFSMDFFDRVTQG